MTTQNDYLRQSGKIDNELLMAETVNIWNELIQDTETENHDKNFMRSFFIPYRISAIKFQLNYGYIRDQEYILDWVDHEERKYEKDYVSPTLRRLYQNWLDIPFGYPTIFIASFPDVVSWAAGGEGLVTIKFIFDSFPVETFTKNSSINELGLLLILKSYLKKTGKELECAMLI